MFIALNILAQKPPRARDGSGKKMKRKWILTSETPNFSSVITFFHFRSPIPASYLQ